METEVTSLTDSDLINSGLKISLELAEGGPEDKSWAGASSLVTLGHVNTELELEAGPAYTLHQVEAASSLALEDIPVMVDLASCSSNTDTNHHTVPVVVECGPPPAPWSQRPHSILKQRRVTPGAGAGSKHRLSRTGANRYEDRERRERYRRTACDREKVRMRDMNRSFEQLRARVPGTRRGRRTSKIESLQLAIAYIRHPQSLLSLPPPPPDLHHGSCQGGNQGAGGI